MYGALLDLPFLMENETFQTYVNYYIEISTHTLKQHTIVWYNYAYRKELKAKNGIMIKHINASEHIDAPKRHLFPNWRFRKRMNMSKAI